VCKKAGIQFFDDKFSCTYDMKPYAAVSHSGQQHLAELASQPVETEHVNKQFEQALEDRI